MAEKDKSDGRIAEIVEVTTQTGQAIKVEDGTIIDTAELLVRIYNKLLKIEKAVA